MRSTITLLVLFIFLLASSTVAQAQTDAPPELDLPPWAQAERSYAGVNVEAWPSTLGDGPTAVRQTAVALEPFARVMVSDHWVETASVPFGIVDVRAEDSQVETSVGSVVIEGADQTTFVVGSVTLGAHYTANVSNDHLNLWAGLRLAIPTMLMSAGNGATRGTDGEQAAGLLNAIRARTHAHRFAVQQLGIRPELGLEWLNPDGGSLDSLGVPRPQPRVVTPRLRVGATW